MYRANSVAFTHCEFRNGAAQKPSLEEPITGETNARL